MTEETNARVCAIVLEGVPFIYYGELYYDSEDTLQAKPILKKALIKKIDLKTNACSWIKVPTAGVHSTVHIDPATMRCILVKNIEESEAQEYRREAAQLYSKLHLV
jgi:hypothetical protein